MKREQCFWRLALELCPLKDSSFALRNVHLSECAVKAHPGTQLFSLQLELKQEKPPRGRHKLYFVVTVETSSHRCFSLELS